MSVPKKAIVVYKASWCGVCESVLPQIQQLADEKGVKLEVVDVDKCNDECKKIRYVPFFEVDGKEMPIDQVVKMLREK